MDGTAPSCTTQMAVVKTTPFSLRYLRPSNARRISAWQVRRSCSHFLVATLAVLCSRSFCVPVMYNPLTTLFLLGPLASIPGLPALRLPFSEVSVYGTSIALADTCLDKIYDALTEASPHQQYIGFDCEWEVTSSGPGRIAVVQITTPDRQTLVIQVLKLCRAQSTLMRGLKSILEDSAIAKVGAGIAGDVAKMGRDWGIQVWPQLPHRMPDFAILLGLAH